MKAPEGLLPLLDEHIELLARKLALLRRMDECVRGADMTALAAALKEEADLGGELALLEQRTGEIRAWAARALGRPGPEATLGRLARALDEADALALNDRRERLAMAVGELREQAAATGALVRQVLEFNGKLLAALVGAEDQSPTYSASGEVAVSCEGTTIEHSV